MASETSIHRDIRGRSTSRRVAVLAGCQHGVVSRVQLLALGLSEDVVDRWLSAGRLHPVHLGVYAVGHRVLSRPGRWMAAVLAAGLGATLSHRAAAALWDLRQSDALEVTTPRRCRREGIVAHEAVLPPDEITTRDGIPVTTVARTLLDLAAVLARDDVRHALEEAEYQRLTDVTPLDALMARYPGRRGSASIRALLQDARLGLDISKRELEKAFFAFIVAEGLPRPHRNVLVEGFECDCVWRSHRLIVELDSRKAHATRKRFESDRLRDRKLTLAGWRVIRVTWRHLHQGRRALAIDLTRAMSTSGPTSSARRASTRGKIVPAVRR